MGGITFIGCGAFSGLAAAADSSRAIGFGTRQEDGPSARTVRRESRVEADRMKRYVSYGMMPELMGRCQLIEFQSLDKEELRAILEHNVLPPYKDQFSKEGLTLEVEDGVVEWVAENALRLKTGARGLNASLSAALQDAAFNCFGDKRFKVVRLALDHDSLQTVAAA